MYTKFIIVCDDDIDVRNWREVVWVLATRVDPGRDVLIAERTPIDYLDFASPVAGLGSKMGVDATNKWPGERERHWGRPIVRDDASSGVPARRHAGRRRTPRCCALMRSRRGSPDPFSSTTSGASMFCAVSHWRMTRAASSARAGGPASSPPMVRNSCRAITLFEYLLMSRTISASGSDSCT